MKSTTPLYLLQQVTSISKKYDEVAKITGERFNIFQILGLSTQEVRMHSALLGSLLDAKGKHGCGDAFLKLFINQFLTKSTDHIFNERLKNFVTSDCHCKVEHHIGYKSDDRTEGGRIDLLISDCNNKHIIIENKIYAGDQYAQLVSYNKAFPDAPIFYLTLDGKEPDTNSKQHLETNVHYACISYKNDMVTWLEACVKEAVNFPLLRETLNQYIYLIKSLTYQTNNHKMSNEIVDLIISSPENFESARNIRSALDASLKVLLDKFKGQLEEVAKRLNLELVFAVAIDEKYSGFWFVHPDLNEDNLRITFQFEYQNTNGFYFGIASRDTNFSKMDHFKNTHQAEFRKISGLNNKPTQWYPALGTITGMENWGGKEYQEIISGVMAKRIEEKVVELMNAFRAVDPGRYRFLPQ